MRPPVENSRVGPLWDRQLIALAEELDYMRALVAAEPARFDTNRAHWTDRLNRLERVAIIIGERVLAHDAALQPEHQGKFGDLL